MSEPETPDENAPAPVGREADSARRRGMLGRIAVRVQAKAEIAFPAVPALVDHFRDILADHFAALGRPFSQVELDNLRRILHGKLLEAFRASQVSSVLVRYGTADDGSLRIDYGVAASTSSVAERYEYWVETRKPPLFGANADARVLAAASELPAGARIADIGAGTGRNSFPLARLGFEVDSVEPTPVLADILEADAAKEGLSVHVVRADATSGDLPLEAGRHRLVIASQVTSHFRGPGELRALLRTCARALSPGGHALISAFLTHSTYHADRAARELGQVFWSTFFTAKELEEALSGLPLSLVSDQDALEYERAHLPKESWPPTGWYEGWARGEDVFGAAAAPSIGLRWLYFVRKGGSVPAT